MLRMLWYALGLLVLLLVGALTYATTTQVLHYWGWIGAELSFRDALITNSMLGPLGALLGGLLGTALSVRLQQAREAEPPKTPLYGEDVWRLALLIALEDQRPLTDAEDQELEALVVRATRDQFHEAYALTGDPATRRQLDTELREHAVV